MSPMEAAFATHEAKARAAVMAETWGHLAPRVNKRYSGWIVFTLTEYGCYEIIASNWRGLYDSPWLYEDMNEFVVKHAKAKGGLYRFDGQYMKDSRGKANWNGKVKRLNYRLLKAS